METARKRIKETLQLNGYKETQKKHNKYCENIEDIKSALYINHRSNIIIFSFQQKEIKSPLTPFFSYFLGSLKALFSLRDCPG